MAELPPNPNSCAIMATVDDLAKEQRELVYEYGLTIVAGLIEEGCSESEQLAEVLAIWRERRQAQWLATDYIKPRRDRIAAAFERATR